MKRHLQVCRRRAETEGRADTAAIFDRALEVIDKPYIRCLAITDTGTIGLDEIRWRSLVMQEGAVSKPGEASGGSYGTGKNAALNVSDLRVVFYSTRYVRGRKGRVEKLQGKATLMAHPDPDEADGDLQHIGFYAKPDGEPFMGREIPDFFRLGETGAGVFIMGFDPRSDDWMDEVAIAVAENFFCAIHRRELVVNILAADSERVIDHQTIASIFDKMGSRAPDFYFYYQAVRSDDGDPTNPIKGLGRVRLHTFFEPGAPRRFALLNRRGMLITDSREQKTNPLAPVNRSVWPDFAGVVIADADSGDRWLRRMENPSHDSLSIGHLRDMYDRREADETLRKARAEIRGIMDEISEVNRYTEESNIDELSDVLGDYDRDGEVPLDVSTIPTKPSEFGDGAWEGAGGGGAEDEDEWFDDGDEGGAGGGEGSDDDSSDSESEGGGDGDNSRKVESLPNVNGVRIVPVGDTEAIVSFDARAGVKATLSLSPAGADADRRIKERVRVLSAEALSGPDVSLSVSDDGAIIVESTSNGRVAVRTRMNGDVRRGAFRIG